MYILNVYIRCSYLFVELNLKNLNSEKYKIKKDKQNAQMKAEEETKYFKSYRKILFYLPGHGTRLQLFISNNGSVQL